MLSIPALLTGKLVAKSVPKTGADLELTLEDGSKRVISDLDHVRAVAQEAPMTRDAEPASGGRPA